MNILYIGLLLLFSCIPILYGEEKIAGDTFDELKKEFNIIQKKSIKKQLF